MSQPTSMCRDAEGPNRDKAPGRKDMGQKMLGQSLSRCFSGKQNYLYTPLHPSPRQLLICFLSL